MKSVLCHKLACEIIHDFQVSMPDGSLANFRYRVGGLSSFAEELKSAKKMRLFGQTVAVLPLERICASKAATNRPKDRVHLFYLR